MNDVILPDDVRAATFVQVNGWVSRDGRYYGADERMARWDGATHVRCRDCAEVIPKAGYVVCAACLHSIAEAKFAQRERRPWDGTQMVYDEASDRFFASPDEVFEWADDEAIAHAALRLVLCDPVTCRLLDADHFSDELPEDGDLPDVVAEAIDAFNAAVKGVVLSWQPGKFALASQSEAEGGDHA